MMGSDKVSSGGDNPGPSRRMSQLESEVECLFPTKLPPDPELENFLTQVDTISEVIRSLSSEDPRENERGLRRADILLRDDKAGGKEDIDETRVEVKGSRTVINKVSSSSSNPNEDEMTRDGFMRMVEKDAKERARNRQMRKEKSDALRDDGIRFFRKENYPGALDRFNKAIELIKDSPLLYTNRALTYIRLEIPSKAIEDCDKAIQISENHLKARLYKARAFHQMGDERNRDKYLQEALECNPDSGRIIQDYKKEILRSSLAPAPDST